MGRAGQGKKGQGRVGPRKKGQHRGSVDIERKSYTVIDENTGSSIMTDTVRN